MPQIEYVRVKDSTTGNEFTIAKSNVVPGVEVIDKDAVDVNGHPLPPKSKVNLPAASEPSNDDAAAAKRAAAAAKRRKTIAAKKTAAKTKKQSDPADQESPPPPGDGDTDGDDAANKEES